MSTAATSRPARRQGDPSKIQNTQSIESTGTYNIWYNKWSGFDKDYKSAEKAENRCNVERDSGKTRAKGRANFCLHFSHGTCIKGDKCQFYHRIPTTSDIFPVTLDVFGREKHRNEREDMMGVGSFEREGKNLYITNIANSPDAEKILEKHFGEWGEIEHIRYLTGRGTAFIRYRHRANAEFAKEAMLGQALEHNEVLMVKWANDDPHEHVQELKKRKAEEIVKKTILAKLPKIGEKGSLLDYENSYEDPDKKSRTLQESEHYPFYQEKTEEMSDLQQQWAEYYAQGGTQEAAAAYYAQFSGQQASDSVVDYEKLKYGYSQQHYEQEERVIEGTDNSVYAIPQTSQDYSEQSFEKDAELVENIQNNSIAGLVSYESDDD